MRFIYYLLLATSSLDVLAQSSLPHSTPEEQGVSSKALINFIDATKNSKHEFHSIMILRHGKVVAEGWWNPYKPELKHTLYSVSKSFTATAIGYAVSEKKISVDDKVVSFFPDDLPATISPNLADLRIKHLLSMSVGHETDPTGPVVTKANWKKAFLSMPVDYVPGTKFVYNSVATYMLSAIVQKVTGQSVIDYLTPRLFTPLGIKGMDWETDPHKTNVGWWGLRLKTEDMAKFGQLFLQKGMWNGKQVLSSDWINEASTKKIEQDPLAPQTRKDSSDWLQGYCYQMWRSRYNSYRGDGAFGQYILILPEKDAVIAITSEATDMQSELNLVWEYLLPAFQPRKLSGDPKSAKALRSKLSALALDLPRGVTNTTMEATLSSRKYGMISNDRDLQGLSMNFKDGMCQLTIDTDSLDYQINFGNGKWILSETTKYGPYLVAIAKHNRVGLAPFKIAASYAWKDDKTLELSLRYIESPHHETIRCTFEGNNLTTEIASSFSNAPRMATGVVKPPVSNPPRLIVRGDDMGFSHSGNVALIKSYREGIETSIEVIVPSPWFPETVTQLADNPRVDVGLHFAITSEWDNIKWRPVSDCPSLRNEDGYFYPMLYKNKNYPGQAVVDHTWNLADIEKELRGQLALALKYIPRLSHISGHMGSTGFDPKVKEMVAKVAAEYKIPTVDSDPSKNAISYARFDISGKTTDQRIDGFIEMINHLEDGKTYVYVEHPGIDDNELRAISHIGYEDVAEGRQDVTIMFTSEKVREAIIKRGVELVSYKDVLQK